MGITAYPHPSVELLRQVLSILSHLGEASEVQLCAEIECDLTLCSGLEGIFYLDPLAGVSLVTPPKLVLSGISQICVFPASTTLPHSVSVTA